MLSTAAQVITFFFLAGLAVFATLSGGAVVARETRRANRGGCGGRPTRGWKSAEGPPGAGAASWYSTLPLASWQPPALAFAIVWPILYACLLVSEWLLLRQDRGDNSLWVAAQVLWLVQFAMNVAWTPVFYGAHSVLWGFIILVFKIAVAGALAGTALASNPSDGATIAAFVLQLVYTAWIIFATTLNGYSLFAASAPSAPTRPATGTSLAKPAWNW
jgi:translocator protein